MGKRFLKSKRLELRKLALELLAKHPDGVTSKRLGEMLGINRGIIGFMRGWRGKDKPLKVRLTVPQIEKLGLKTVGLDSYAESSHEVRISVYFHPQHEELYRALKPYETKRFSDTPTARGLRAEMGMEKMLESSRLNVQRSIQKVKGIELSFCCPHCGKEIKLVGG